MSINFRDKYPYTDFHELNLDWVINTVSTNTTRIDTLETEFEQIEILSEEEIDAKIQTASDACNAYTDAQIENVHTEITNEYTEYVDSEISDLKSYSDAQDAQLKLYVDNQDSEMLATAEAYTDTREEATRQYIDDKIINVTYMFNPFRGYQTDVRVVVNDIIDDYLRVNAISAGDYDALNLSAGDYDALNINAYNYDFDGKEILTA